MKSAGIITFHCADNFGAVLQAYALQQALYNLNISSEIIDYRPDILILPYDEKIHWKKTVKNIGILRAIKRFIKLLPYKRKIRNRRFIFEEFRNKNLVITKSTYYTNDELIANPPIYDYYITGSDQVWNPSFVSDTGTTYFLDFAPKDSIKISYAASIAEKVAPELHDLYNENINMLNHISIREKDHSDFIRLISGKTINIALDPTFLIDKTYWMNISVKPNIKDKYILIYDIHYNEELVKLANRISKEKGYKVVSFMNSKIYEKGIKSFQYEGPSEFLGYIENADFILSTSFHGVAFSIIYKKPFYAIPNKKTGSRITNLLTAIALDDRIINRADELISIEYKLDYYKPIELLNNKKSESINFLVNAFYTER